MIDFNEGDKVKVTITGDVLWKGDQKMEIGDYIFDYHQLEAAGVTLEKVG